MNWKIKIGIFLCLVLFSLALLSESAVCQDQDSDKYKIYFKKIEGPDIQKVGECEYNVSFDLEWGIYEVKERGCVEIPAGEISDQNFSLYGWPEGMAVPTATIYQGPENSFTSDSPVETSDKGHRFYVSATFTYENKNYTISSDTASAKIKLDTEGILEEDLFIKATARRRLLWTLWLFSPPIVDYFAFPNILNKAETDCWIVLFIAKRAADNSGWGGKIAFWVIRLCAWIGLIAIIKSWRASHLANIFPLARRINPLKATLAVSPSSVREHSTETIVVRMNVQNTGNVTINNVTPSEFSFRGAGQVVLSEKDKESEPKTKDSLDPGAWTEFTWNYQSKKASGHRSLIFKGYAKGFEESSGGKPVYSRFAIANPLVISDSAILRIAGALRRLIPSFIMRSLTLERRYTANIAAQFDAFTRKWSVTIINLDNEMRKQLTGSSGGSVNLDDVSFKIWSKSGRKDLDEIKTDLETIAKDFGETPTFRVMRAGIVNHVKNAITWFKASEEVDRAIESRANQEIEKIKRNSWVDWLWNLACISPLAGLLGTVTGISFSFKELAEQSGRKALSPLEVIQALAPSINEALWTTIFGLGLAILLMFPYFYFSRKIEWIYSKWEEIYVDVAENL